MASICLCMITKDEKQYIERCIQSVSNLVDEVVVADTGSTDGTTDIIERLGGRVYCYPWDGSFANARNFAMGKAESDWLLLLDADEALDNDSVDTVREFVNTTTLDGAHLRIRNYTGSYVPDNYSLHSGLRLLRNSGLYHYRGEIHEQIVTDSGDNLSSRFATLDAVVHHYGYLDEVVREKQKRKRNIPILEKQLASNPDEPFTLFNLGNEYLSMQDYQTARGYYETAATKLTNKNLAFVPHLFFRMISCYENLRDYDKALESIQAGLRQFPACTDYVFRQGEIQHRLGRYTLAIESFEICLKMGQPPLQLEFLPGCGTFRAACHLGELYLELEDYLHAAKSFDFALSQKPNLYATLYRLGTAFRHIYPDDESVRQKLFAYFAKPEYAPNALLGADILIEEGLFPQALESLKNLTDEADYQMELTYLRARIFFYQQQLDAAVPLLEQVCSAPEPQKRVLRGIRPVSAIMLFSAGLMQNDPELLDRASGYMSELCGESENAAAGLMRAILMGNSPADPHYADEGRRERAVMLRILDDLLKCGQFDLFERMLYSLNYVDSKDVLLRLAELYERNDLLPMAADHVLRSIKELDTIDASGAGILCKLYRQR